MVDLASCQVLVTPTSFGRHDPALQEELESQVRAVHYNRRGRPLTSEELIELIPQFDGFIAGLDDIDRPVIEAAERLRVIARYGVGVDNVDLQAAAEHGIVVCNTPGANAGSVAELAVGLMLALSRQICSASTATKAGGWPRMDGRMLAGKVVGLIGFGAIGQSVAHYLQGFRCQLLAYDPVLAEERADALDVSLVPLAEIQRRADVVSLHCPLTEETRDLIGADFLAAMKPGGLLINTARGELIDEQAVAMAVERGQLAGVGLDVYRQQPPRLPHPLLELSSVIATPHLGSHTDGAVNAMGRRAMSGCLAVLRGEEPADRVV